MNRKHINCPHCGKMLSEDFLNGVIKKKIKCPACGSRRTWRNGSKKRWSARFVMELSEDLFRN